MNKNTIMFIVIAVVILVVIGIVFFIPSDEEEATNTNTTTSTTNTGENVVLTTEESSFSHEGATLIFSNGATEKQGTVEIKTIPVSQAPAANEGEEIMGTVYDITSTATLGSNKSASLTLRYDPTIMPENYTGDETTNENLLYFGHYNGTEWEEVPGAIIDKDNQTVSAPVTEFSYFSFILNPAAAFAQVDIIEGIDRFADLPLGVKQDLDNEYSQGSIKSGLDWTVSSRTRIASQTILGANFVNTISGGILAAIEGGEDMVYDWIAEELVKEIGHDVLSSTFGEESADFAITLYDTATLGSEIYDMGFEGVKNAPMLQAKIAAQILSYTMDYINDNTQEAYSDLATLDWWAYLTSDAPLNVIVVGINGENLLTGYFDQGLKFYYYDNTDKKWYEYANGVVGMDVNDVQITAGTSTNSNTSANTNTSVNTNTSANTNTAVNVNAPAALSGCENVDLSEDYQTYETTKGNMCDGYEEIYDPTSIEWKCANMSASWRGTYIKEYDLTGSDTVTVKADLGLYDSAGLFISTCGEYGVHYANYVRLTVHENDPRDTLDTACVADEETAWTDCAMRETDDDVLGYCGVPKCATSETCEFTIDVPSSGKVYFAYTISDAWGYADVQGTLTDLRVCSL
ncbi:hypothetical protein ACFL0L_03890 [Patescibacteria group bacterium]